MKNVVLFIFALLLMTIPPCGIAFAEEDGAVETPTVSSETPGNDNPEKSVSQDSGKNTADSDKSDTKAAENGSESPKTGDNSEKTPENSEKTVESAENPTENDEKSAKNAEIQAENAQNDTNTISTENAENLKDSSKNSEKTVKKEEKSSKKEEKTAKKGENTSKNGKNQAKKDESQQTKPRKYTGDKWELKISTSEVKAAVESKPAIRGIHITAWVAGSEPLRKKIIGNIRGTVLNSVVIALKEMDGAVYIKGVEKAEKYKAYTSAIANPEKMVEDFKREGLYTIGRIVLFKDDVLPVKRPDLAVKTPEGNIWRDRKGKTWADQYSKEVWDYNIAVALRAVEAGFDEIQFDYIRYPSEGKVSLCRYSVPHNWDKARANLAEFLRYARERIPEQIRISADVFGLTTSARDDMGIGQNLPLIAQYADYVYPMMYPSHYYTGHYGLRNPNSEPYKVINFGLRDAMARLELNYAKLRPYLQDFSKYGPHEVGEQIRALRKNYLHSWVMWSPNNKYSWEAYKPEYYKKYIDPDYEP